MNSYKIKAGCDGFTITATLQGVRLDRKPLSRLTQPQMQELYERFNHPYIIKVKPENEKTEAQPTKRNAPKKPKHSGEQDTAGNE